MHETYPCADCGVPHAHHTSESPVACDRWRDPYAELLGTHDEPALSEVTLGARDDASAEDFDFDEAMKAGLASAKRLLAEQGEDF